MWASRASFWWTYLGAFIGGAWTMLVGTVAAAMYPKLEFATALRTAADAVVPGFGKPLLLCCLAGLVTITTLNFYGASLTLLCVLDSFKPGRPTLARRLLTLILSAAAGDRPCARARPRISWKNSASSWPCCCICSRRGRRSTWSISTGCARGTTRCARYSIPHGMYGRWNWRGLAAYGVGFAAMIPFFSVRHYTGPVAKALGGADIAMLVGLPVAAAAYYLACRSMNKKRQQPVTTPSRAET